jgi:hypothetical protein
VVGREEIDFACDLFASTSQNNFIREEGFCQLMQTCNCDESL